MVAFQTHSEFIIPLVPLVTSDSLNQVCTNMAGKQQIPQTQA